MINSWFIEILTEEPSMANFLRVILPKILPEDYQLDINCFIRPHEGKSHLQKSIPKKMRAYSNYGHLVKVLIIHDQDSNDCIALKRELAGLCSGNAVPAIIRIACRELENWYLGDMQAIERVYPDSKSRRLAAKAKYRNPDIVTGSEELQKMTKKFSKTHASREIPKYMDITNNNSKSFNQFVKGLEKLIAIE